MTDCQYDAHNNLIMDLSSVGINASVRYKRFSNGIRLSEVDIVKAVTGFNNNMAAQVLRRMGTDLYDIHIDSKTSKFKGNGQQETKLITLEGAYKLIMILPGTTAKNLRIKVIEALVNKLKEMGEETAIEDIFHKILQLHVHDTEREEKSQTTEFLYAFATAAFPGLIKIGRTYDVGKRIQNLNTAMAPKPFYMVAMVPTLDSVRDEKKAHDFFGDKREAGEFFRVTSEEIIDFFNTEIAPVFYEEMKERVDESTETLTSRQSPKRMRYDEEILQEQPGSIDVIVTKERYLRNSLLEAQIKETEAKALLIMVDAIKSAQDHYMGLCANGNMDDNARRHFKKRYLDISMEASCTSIRRDH